MGKAVEEIALQRGHEIIGKIDRAEEWEKSADLFAQADAVIDFSLPAVVVDNIYRCFKYNIPVITGTTGWYDRLEEVKRIAIESNQSLFIGSNFSLGVNILFSLNRKLAQFMDKFPDFDVIIKETHHIHKVDSPSGTAITLGNEIIKSLQRKKEWVNHASENPEQLEIISKREGEEVGYHEIIYSSDIENLSIVHEAKSRKGFAIGAVVAAEWMQGKKGVFGMQDVIGG